MSNFVALMSHSQRTIPKISALIKQAKLNRNFLLACVFGYWYCLPLRVFRQYYFRKEKLPTAFLVTLWYYWAVM